jgi:hypothetical protein
LNREVGTSGYAPDELAEGREQAVRRRLGGDIEPDAESDPDDDE